MATFLVVDDEQRICRFVARALTANGYQVDTAATGEQALRLASANEYALIILDLIMPGMTGYEVLQRLVDSDPAQRVLVLSAVGDVDSKVRCLRLGAVDYLSKPFAIAELIERVKRRVHERVVPPASRWLDAGGARMDLHRHTLHIGDHDITLTPKEFILLGHLMRHPNEVCSRLDLLAAGWGYSFDPGSNVVDVCVRRLRTKLTSDLIETVRNVGYSFVAS
jgi:two-component system OmpR family response regulator